MEQRRIKPCLPGLFNRILASGIRFLVLVAVPLIGQGAHAAPPPDADPALSPWFRSLQAPDTGRSCCSITDCRPTEARTRGDHYEVLIEDRWLAVPPEKVLSRTDNPTGRAIVCWTPTLGIMCFIHGPEG